MHTCGVRSTMDIVRHDALRYDTMRPKKGGDLDPDLVAMRQGGVAPLTNTVWFARPGRLSIIQCRDKAVFNFNLDLGILDNHRRWPVRETYVGDLMALRHRLMVSAQRPWYTFNVYSQVRYERQRQCLEFRPVLFFSCDAGGCGCLPAPAMQNDTVSCPSCLSKADLSVRIFFFVYLISAR